MSYSGTVLADAPVAYYRFGEDSGAAMLDSSGHHRDGSYLNGAVPSAASLLAGDPANSALTLDGVDDYAKVPYDAAWMTPTTAFTAEFWFKPATIAAGHIVVARSNNATPFGNTYSWLFYQQGNQLIFYVFVGNSGTLGSATMPTALVAGTTYHVVGTFDGATIRLYINGAQVATAALAGTMNTAPNIDLTFGASHNNSTGERFSGTLDDVSLYNAVLSPARITAHRNAGITLPVIQTAAVAVGGNGALTPTARQVQIGAVALGGSGGVVASAPPSSLQAAGVALGGEGTLTVTAEAQATHVEGDSGTPIVVMAILDPELDQAPNMLLVAVEEGVPDTDVEFHIDGTLVYTATLDSDGALPAISVPVPDTVMAGEHTLTLAPQDPTYAGMSATFTVDRDPDPLPESVGPDADPVEVAGAVEPLSGVRRWVLQDLMPGGLGSWVMPTNPASADPFPFKRTLTPHRTEHVNGRYHITEPIGEVFTWSFTGRYADRATQDQLEAFTALDRRFYLIDHRNRAWTVALVGVDLVPHKRIVEDDGTDNDETGTYTVRALVFGHDWKVPQ